MIEIFVKQNMFPVIKSCFEAGASSAEGPVEDARAAFATAHMENDEIILYFANRTAHKVFRDCVAIGAANTSTIEDETWYDIDVPVSRTSRR